MLLNVVQPDKSVCNTQKNEYGSNHTPESRTRNTTIATVLNYIKRLLLCHQSNTKKKPPKLVLIFISLVCGRY